MPGFLIEAAIAGLLLAALAGPLGSMVIWRRMAYFGETLAHATMLGIGLALLLGFSPFIGVVAVCVGLGLLLARLQSSGQLAPDALLGIFSHGALALGLLLVSLSPQRGAMLESFLFGDLLTVATGELITLGLMAVAILAALAWQWKALVSVTVQPELAQVEGINPNRVNAWFMCLVALTIVAGIKMVGVILVTAMLIIPAATARRFSSSPEQMAGLAAVLGGVGVLCGLALAFALDTSTGPSIVSANLVLFFLSRVVPGRTF